MDLEDAAIGAMEPGDDEDFVAGRDSGQRRREIRPHVQPRVGRTFGALPGRKLPLLEGRADHPDRIERGCVPHHAHPVDERGEPLRPGTVVGSAALAPVAHQARPTQQGEMLGDRWLGRPARRVRATTVSSPSRQSRSKIARRVGSARVRRSRSVAAGMIYPTPIGYELSTSRNARPPSAHSSNELEESSRGKEREKRREDTGSGQTSRRPAASNP